MKYFFKFFFFQAEDGIRDGRVTGVQTCALPISQRMGDALTASGYVATEEIGEADLVLLNTCHIREKAAEKVYSEIGRIRQIKKQREIGRASCRERVENAVGAGTVEKEMMQKKEQ